MADFDPRDANPLDPLVNRRQVLTGGCVLVAGSQAWPAFAEPASADVVQPEPEDEPEQVRPDPRLLFFGRVAA